MYTHFSHESIPTVHIIGIFIALATERLSSSSSLFFECQVDTFIYSDADNFSNFIYFSLCV